MKVVLIWSIVIIICLTFHGRAIVVAEPWLRLSHVSVWPYMWWALASAGLDDSIDWQFALNILVILILAIQVTLHRSRLALDNCHWLLLGTVGVLEIIRESGAIGSALVLLQGCVILLALSRNTRQLLLRLRDSDARLQLATSLPILWGWSAIASGCKSDLFILVLILLDIQLWFAGLNLVALLTNSFVWDIVTLLLVLLLLVSDLQVPIYESGGKFVLRDGCR